MVALPLDSDPPAVRLVRAAPRTGDETLSSWLRRGFWEGRLRHGPIPLELEVFSARVQAILERRLARERKPRAPAQCVTLLRAAERADLFLAIACDEGIEAAWVALRERVLPRLAAVARRAGASAAEARELVEDLAGNLWLDPGLAGARTRLASYEGSASLVTFLATLVRRRLYRDRRRPRPAALDLGEEPESGAGPALATEVSCADSAVVAAAGEGLLRAWAGLTPRERFVLRARTRAACTQRRIATRLGISESRASRVIHHALARLRSGLGHSPPIGEIEPPELACMTLLVDRMLDQPEPEAPELRPAREAGTRSPFPIVQAIV